MRLSQTYQQRIKALTQGIFGPEAQVKVFGSRVNDEAKGGDLDLLIITPLPVERPAVMASKLAVKVSRLLEGRKVDVLVDSPSLERKPIHDTASQQGVTL
ncbi:nucleotidyltransferase domain-containing protein [Halomonas llamarensis]|uniref:Nucleotidyltransferase domain-containing protein n=1 Tax=Halomonas llamarensis TaxID=2945104 RepID=A0ABT0SP12_9GAMM|nr:nucleotidyltransferase domain-containing protein [Halomonas llamarensis]MCL7929573.1 nucleotidyltransferase domain-containing protein [Halomonas llamarensis]